MKESKRYLPRSVIVAMATVIVILGVGLAANSTTTTVLMASPAMAPSQGPGDVDYW